jgi:hypothetical protein
VDTEWIQGVVPSVSVVSPAVNQLHLLIYGLKSHGNPGARLSELLVKITIGNYPGAWPSGAIG